MSRKQGRLRQWAIISTLLTAVGIMFVWSQTWFVFTTEYSTEIAPEIIVSGQVVAPVISAYGLLIFALLILVPFLPVSLRRISGLIISVVGILVLVMTIQVLSNPVLASMPAFTAVTGISDSSTIENIITSEQTAAFPILSIAVGALGAVSGIMIVITSAQWRSSNRKYQQQGTDEQLLTQQAEASKDSSSNIDLWDNLSHGTDPTTR